MKLRNSFMLVLLTAAALTTTAEDPARAAAQRAFDAHAGKAWEPARYFAFTFAVEREGKLAASFDHRLDRYTGEYRVSGKDKDGNDFVIRMNVNTREGKAWVAGKPVEELKPWLERGYGRFINDVYWLLMPTKLLDDGTHLEYAGVQEEGGRSYDVVKLTFDNVGLTPGDIYWPWIDRESGSVDRWDMLLEGMKRDDPKRVFRFSEWKTIGGIRFSTVRTSDDGKTRILLQNIDVQREVPASALD
ncbi:MAG: hypothetical protein HYU52_10460 [Acidobacteria bacterium]|nr:hypothetical protein [Acidobacteriota bacterium]